MITSTFLLLDNSMTLDEIGKPFLTKNVGNQDIIVTGNLNGATIYIEQKSSHGDRWAPIDGGSFTEPESRTLVSLPFQRTIRARVDGTASGAYVEVTR